MNQRQFQKELNHRDLRDYTLEAVTKCNEARNAIINAGYPKEAHDFKEYAYAEKHVHKAQKALADLYEAMNENGF